MANWELEANNAEGVWFLSDPDETDDKGNRLALVLLDDDLRTMADAKVAVVRDRISQLRQWAGLPSRKFWQKELVQIRNLIMPHVDVADI